MLKGSRVGDIVDHAAAVGSAVEGARERLEALLASGVPDLKDTNFVILEDDFAVGEIGTNGGLEMGGELPLLEKVY